MGVYEDVKTAIERVLTPDLGEIKARLSAVEQQVHAVETNLTKRMDEVDQRSEKRDQEIVRVMERGFDRLAEQIGNLSRQVRVEEELRDVVQRLAAVESKLKDRDRNEATH